MLPARNRLRRSRDFSAAVRSGRRIGSATVVIHLRLGEDPLGSARVGLVVGRAVGPAVTRNLVKRRLRHLVRDRLQLLPGGATLVVRALPAAASVDAARLAADLDRALHRALRAGSGRLTKEEAP